MRNIEEVINRNKNIRVIGFDDAPFEKAKGSPVNISGIVCSNTRFEGMLWGEATRDGTDATDTIINMIKTSKFYDQAHVIITDGVAIGGFNIIDFERLTRELALPCIAVMRKHPNLEAIDNALKHFTDYEERKATISKAGKIHTEDPFVFQAVGCTPETAFNLLSRLTDNGKVPEALRLAHLIGSAIKTGQSSNRA